MADMMHYLHEVNLLSITVRLLLATICGGIIGIERGTKKRPAGFRTHILVCMGAAVIMITNQYMSDVLGMDTDPSRMGAQVISGIGFLGAGTIIVVGRNQVKGLTTAAGLWVCACMGLAIGIGFYEGAVIGCVFLFGAMTGLHGLDNYVQSNSRVMEIYVELQDIEALTNLLKKLKDEGIKTSNLEIQRVKKEGTQQVGAIITLKLVEKNRHQYQLLEINRMDGVCFAEELN